MTKTLKGAIDLNIDVRVIGCKTIRQKDGLAMSSRNLLLNEKGRKIAPQIYQNLCYHYQIYYSLLYFYKKKIIKKLKIIIIYSFNFSNVIDEFNDIIKLLYSFIILILDSLSKLAVKRSINAYNNLRPHMSCGYMTPVVAHITNEPLIKKWRNSRRRNLKLKEQTAFHQHKEINLPL